MRKIYPNTNSLLQKKKCCQARTTIEWIEGEGAGRWTEQWALPVATTNHHHHHTHTFNDRSMTFTQCAGWRSRRVYSGSFFPCVHLRRYLYVDKTCTQYYKNIHTYVCIYFYTHTQFNTLTNTPAQYIFICLIDEYHTK